MALIPSILEEADRLIHGERHEQYGEASVVFERYATGWSLIIGAPVTPEQVAMCMVWLKLMRERNKHDRDNLKDAAGYLGLADDVIEGLGPRSYAEVCITCGLLKKYHPPMDQTRPFDKGSNHQFQGAVIEPEL